MTRALLLLIMLYGSHAAAGGITAPARLAEGPDSIESLLRLPEDLRPGRYQVSCEVWVRKHGRAESFICYHQDESPRSVVKAVSSAGRRAKFVPAMRDGVPADVYMVVMVRIDMTAQGPLVLVVPNNGAEEARFGLQYTAPQRFNEFTWEGYSGPDRGSSILLWQKMQIDENGTVVEFSVKNVADVPQFTVRSVERQIQRMKFMPGYVNGKPTAMLYIEPLLDDGG
jgi:hypothetical protein